MAKNPKPLVPVLPQKKCTGLPVVILLLTGLFCSPFLSAQSYSRSDSVAIYKLLDEADGFANASDYTSAIKKAEQALQVSRQKKMLRGEAFAKLSIANALLQDGVSQRVEDLNTEGWNAGLQLRDSFILALSSLQQAQYQRDMGRYEAAEKLFNQAMAIKFGKEQSMYTGITYNDRGHLYGIMGLYEKQADQYLRAIRVYEKINYLPGLAQTSNNLAEVYNAMGDTIQCLAYIKKSIQLYRQTDDVAGTAFSYANMAVYYRGRSLDSAIKYQQIAKEFADKTGDKKLIIISNDNMSVLMDKQRRKAEALAYIKVSIDMCREMGDKQAMADKMRWAAILAGDLKDTALMNDYYTQVSQIARELNNKKMLRDLYASKKNYYRKNNFFKEAYDNQDLYYAYRDSIVSMETEANIAELQTRYETEKKDNEINRLQTQQRIKQLEVEKQKAIIAGNKLEAERKENEIKLLSQQQQLRDARIKQQGEEIEKQVLLAKNSSQALQLAEQEKKLKDRQLLAQHQLRNSMIAGAIVLILLAGILFNRYKLKRRLEQQNQLLQVRNNIAKDLHDEIGSTLTSIKILSEVSQNNLEKDKQKASVFISKITEQSALMQQGMSDIVWAIKPDNDKLENMLVRMREYAAHTLEPKQVQVVFEVNEDVLLQSLDMQQRRDFFLIFKEAVNNAAKYAAASRVDIRLIRDKGQLLVQVEDNGKGFDTGEPRASNGLKNMKARATALGGNCRIESAPGQGTLISITLPAT